MTRCWDPWLAGPGGAAGFGLLGSSGGDVEDRRGDACNRDCEGLGALVIGRAGAEQGC